MTVLDHARKLVADCDEELHFERRVKRELQRLIAEIERLESELESIGAGGVGPLMPVANSPEIPDSSDQGGQHLDMVQAGWKLVPVEPTRDMLTKWIKAVVVSNTTAPDLYQAMLAAAPQPPTIKESLIVEQEPVAWAIFVDSGNARMWTTFQPHIQKLADAEGLAVTPLYTHPQPKREPLTDEEILKLAYPLRWDEVDDFEADRAINFVQVIERAHGIEGEA